MDTDSIKLNESIQEIPAADVATEMDALQEDESLDQELDNMPIDDDADDEVVGSNPYIRYNRAFVAKMSQAPDNLKSYYNILKNTLLSYKGVKSRISWCNDSYNRGRNRLAKINVRGNGLIVYLALDPNAYQGTKYRYRDVGYKKKYADMPMQIKIRSKRGLRYAIELTADLMAGLSIPQGTVGHVAYAPKYEDLDSLMQRNLVRLVQSHVGTPDVKSPKDVLAAKLAANQPVAQEVACADAAPSVEEPVPVKVDVRNADEQLSDSQAAALVEADTAPRKNVRLGNKKAMVNIDVISRSFKAGDEVDVLALIKHKLVPSNTGWVKVCARGALDKPLTIKANDYSPTAVKMIALTGGRAIKVK